MICVSFDRLIEGLVAYLDNAREYLELMLEFGGEEVEIVQDSQAYSMKANWKLLVENSMDGYHAIPTTSASSTSTWPTSAWTRRAGLGPTESRALGWHSAAVTQ